MVSKFTKIKSIVVIFFSIALSITPLNPFRVVQQTVNPDEGVVCAAANIDYDAALQQLINVSGSSSTVAQLKSNQLEVINLLYTYLENNMGSFNPNAQIFFDTDSPLRNQFRDSILKPYLIALSNDIQTNNINESNIKSNLTNFACGGFFAMDLGTDFILSHPGFTAELDEDLTLGSFDVFQPAITSILGQIQDCFNSDLTNVTCIEPDPVNSTALIFNRTVRPSSTNFKLAGGDYTSSCRSEVSGILNNLNVGGLLTVGSTIPVATTTGSTTGGEYDYTTLGSGISCVNNYGNCPGGYNLLERTISSQLFDTITRNKLQESLELSYGNDYANICVKQSFSDVIVRWMAFSEFNNAGICKVNEPNPSCQNIESVASTTGFQDRLFAVPRYCPVGWNPQRAPNRLNFTVGFVSGCCPSGYKFVNTSEQSAVEALQAGVCCKIPNSGVTPGIYIVEGVDPSQKGCYTSDKQIIYSADKLNQADEIAYDTLDEALKAMVGANMIIGVKVVGGKFVPSVDATTEVGSDIIKPQFGLGMGVGYPSGSITVAPQKLAPKKCASNFGCFLDNTDTLRSIQQGGVNVFDQPANVGLKCERCFSPGEPINVDAATSTLNICDPSQTDSTRSVPLCNGSVIDTIACLGGANSASQSASAGGVDSENYNLCCNCRAQGGVWTGIGCTDTTPSGLITGLIRIVYGVMGGVALIMLIYAGIMYQTGNEANVKKARELIIRTVTGLIVLTFSILILRIIGINILDILPAGSI